MAASPTRPIETPRLDKTADSIREMFAGVAPRYDLLNRLLSARRDVAWRRAAAAALEPLDGVRSLDLCCGTGDQALALAERGAVVTAADFCIPMLALAEPKYSRAGDGRRPTGLAADSLHLPLPERRFAVATVAFGLRNVADLDRGLREIARVLEPGGRVAFLEFAVPRRQPLRWLYLTYFTKMLPLVGKALSHRGSAYDYLPTSVIGFPQRDEMVERLALAGFVDGAWRDLTGGIVCLYTAAKETA